MLNKLTLVPSAQKKEISLPFIDWTDEGVFIDEEIFYPLITTCKEEISTPFYNTWFSSFSEKDLPFVEQVLREKKKWIVDLSSLFDKLLQQKRSSLEELFERTSKEYQEIFEKIAEKAPLAVCLGSFCCPLQQFVEDEKLLYKEYGEERALPLELFRYELMMHLIEKLSAIFSGISSFVAIDFANVSLDTAFFLSSKEYFERVHLLSINTSPSSAFLVKQNGRISSHFAEEQLLAVLLPSTEWGVIRDLVVLEVLSTLKEKNIAFKTIAEPYFHLEWTQLQQVIVFSSYLSKEGMRRLHGFIAAEGEVIVVGNPLDISIQTDYESFIKQTAYTDL